MAEANYSEEELFFVGIANSKQIRKGILEAEKEIIMNLNRLESYKPFRSNKLANMYDLNKVFKEINLLNTKLRKALPKTGISPSSWRSKLKRTATPLHKDRLKQLESELDHVEGKLGELLP